MVGYMTLTMGAAHGGNARATCGLLDLPRAGFMELYEGSSGTTGSLHHAIHRSLMRSPARTNTQLTGLISHARLTASTRKAQNLEAALLRQIWRRRRPGLDGRHLEGDPAVRR